MTGNFREDADWQDGVHTGIRNEQDGTFEARLSVVLAGKPVVEIPTDFAARMADKGMRLSPAPPAPARGHASWGLSAAMGGIVLLFVLMLRYALSAPGPVSIVAEMTLCGEFLILLFGFVHVRRVLG